MCCLKLSKLMTLDDTEPPHNGFSLNFSQFVPLLVTQIVRMKCTEMARPIKPTHIGWSQKNNKVYGTIILQPHITESWYGFQQSKTNILAIACFWEKKIVFFPSVIIKLNNNEFTEKFLPDISKEILIKHLSVKYDHWLNILC